MAISKEKKKGIIENIGKIVKDSSSVVFVNFHGLLMNDTTELRKTLNAKEVGYTVAKKSLKKSFCWNKD